MIIKQKVRHVSLIPYTCGWGAQNRGCALGPNTLKEWGLAEKLHQEALTFSWTSPYKDRQPPKNLPFRSNKERQLAYLPRVIEHSKHLFQTVQECLNNGDFPLVIGGDHSQAIATFSAVVEHFQCHDSFGLIWIDAHLDAHTPTTSPSGAFHGMPIASLLGLGARELATLGSEKAKILPQHLCYIGVRSFEEEETALIANSGAHVYFIEEVKQRGFPEVFKEALERVCKRTKYFGLSIDLDCFDPKFAPGTGSLEKNGLDPKDVLPALKGLCSHPQCRAAEITEYNPEIDVNMKTAELCLKIVQTLFFDKYTPFI